MTTLGTPIDVTAQELRIAKTETVRYRLGDVIAWRNERTIGRKPAGSRTTDPKGTP